MLRTTKKIKNYPKITGEEEGDKVKIRRFRLKSFRQIRKGCQTANRYPDADRAGQDSW